MHTTEDYFRDKNRKAGGAGAIENHDRDESEDDVSKARLVRRGLWHRMRPMLEWPAATGRARRNMCAQRAPEASRKCAHRAQEQLGGARGRTLHRA